MSLGIRTVGLAMFGLGSLLTCTQEHEAFQGIGIEGLFNFVAQKNPDYALGMAYTTAHTAPQVMVAGRTKKDGAVDVIKDARWHIGSITKSFTATLIMKLVERGQLDLDAPIGKYLRRYNKIMHPDWQALTLRALLTHTAGVPANASRRVLLESIFYEPHRGRRTVLSGLWREPLGGKVGEFNYSNIGYVLVGIIAEEVTNKPWEDLIRTEIAEPLGLDSLGFGAPTGPGDPRGHSSVLGWTKPVSGHDDYADNPAWMGPAGAIHLSVADLAKWGQLHLRACKGELPNFLSAASCRLMQTPNKDDYGFGWVINPPNEDGKVIWHNGSNTMWYAMLYLNRTDNTVVAAVTNVAAPRRIDRLAEAVSREM